MKEERVERFEILLEIRDGREVEEGGSGGDLLTELSYDGKVWEL